MSDNIYIANADNYAEIIDEGTCEGYHYVIVSYGSHPCAYVKIPEGHPCYGLDYGKIFISCHGGLTFSSMGLYLRGKELRPGYWIGWDYAHFGDHVELPGIERGGKRWTIPEIRTEVEHVVWQLAGHAGGAMPDE